MHAMLQADLMQMPVCKERTGNRNRDRLSKHYAGVNRLGSD